MTSQQIYVRALNRMRSRIATMERNLNGASLSVHEEFEELCLLVALLEQFTRPNGSDTPLSFKKNGLSSHYHNGQSPAAQRPMYVIIDIESHEQNPFATTDDEDREGIEQYGGRVLVARSNCEVIEGSWRPKRIVVQRWPSIEAFHRWYDSHDGINWKALPNRKITNLVLIEALENEIVEV